MIATDALRAQLLDADAFVVPDPYLRAAVVFDSVEVHGSRVVISFTVQPIAEVVEDSKSRAPKFAVPDYRSVRMVLPEAQALSLLASLEAALG